MFQMWQQSSTFKHCFFAWFFFIDWHSSTIYSLKKWLCKVHNQQNMTRFCTSKSIQPFVKPNYCQIWRRSVLGHTINSNTVTTSTNSTNCVTHTKTNNHHCFKSWFHRQHPHSEVIETVKLEKCSMDTFHFIHLMAKSSHIHVSWSMSMHARLFG